MIEAGTRDAAAIAGIRQIAAYPRRHFRIAPERAPWEYDYHNARCLHAVAAEMILELEGPADVRETYLRRMSKPDVTPNLRSKGETAAAYYVAGIARVALLEMGVRATAPITLKLPEEMIEETFCEPEDRFEPMVRLS